MTDDATPVPSPGPAGRTPTASAPTASVPTASVPAAPAGSAPPPPRRAALAFIFVSLILDIVAFGIVIPVLPQLIKGFVGGDTQQAAHWYGIFGTTWAACCVSPQIGRAHV